MKKLASLTGVKTLGRTAQKSINGGSAFGCTGPKKIKGVCGGTPAYNCGCGFPPNASCPGGNIVNGCCYVCL